MLSKQRQISTVLAASITGYSRLVALPEASAESRLANIRAHFKDVVTEFGGSTFHTAGPDLIAHFPSSVYAFRAAIKLQGASIDDEPLQLCTGLHLGEVFVDGGSVTGDGVDVSSRLRKRGAAGEILITSAVYQQLDGKVDDDFEFLGRHEIEGLLHPIGVYRHADVATKKPLRDVFSELFRRRIFRSAGAYFVVAWLVIQASDIILPVFDTPEWVLRSIIILLIVGFPLAMLLTWSVNLSPDGLIKTEDSRYSENTGRWLKFAVVGIATLISGLVLWNIRATIFEPPPTTRVSRSAIKSQPVIAVAELTKRVGDESIDWLGQGISNLVRDSLADSPLTVVYSLAALQSLSAEVDDARSLIQVAKDAGVDYLVVGDYMGTTSGIVISAHIEDLGNGTIIPGDRIQAQSVEDAIAKTSQLVARLKRSLNLPYVDQVGHLAADFAAENLQAYELFVSGLEYLAVYDYENANNLLRDAIDEAPDFGMAKYRLAQILEATGSNRDAFQMLDTINLSALSERERLYVEGAKYAFTENRDPKAAIDIFREAVAKFRFDSESHQYLAESYWFDFQNEASLRQLELLVDLHPQESVSWMALGERQIDVGDIAGARISLAKYVSMRPEDPYPHALLGELASQERNFSEARIHYQRALAVRPNMANALIGLARLAYYEGQYEEAMSQWQYMITSLEVAPDDRIDAAFDYAYVLRSMGQPQESFDVLSRLETEIRREGFRESLALTVKAEALIDLGQYEQAQTLLADAVEKTPSSRQPIRPYFFLAQVASKENDREGFEDIVETMLALPIEAGSVIDNDRTVAANYLTGISLIADDPILASNAIEQALNTPDYYPYRIYELGLAEARLAAGDYTAALAVLEGISGIEPARPRFDLEYDRHLKSALQAEALAADGRTDEAKEVADQFFAAWPNVSAEHPAIKRLNQLLLQL